MLTEFYDDKAGPTYAPNQPIWTIDEKTGSKVWGTVTEVGEETILVQWSDLPDPSEYERQKVELIGDQFYEDKRDSQRLVIPRNNGLLLQVKDFEEKIIAWYNKNCSLTGYNSYVRITERGKWAVDFTIDYPMMPGVKREYILTEEDFLQATTNTPLTEPVGDKKRI